MLVGSDGRARVVDFGVARTDAIPDAESLGATSDPAIDLTLTGTAVGTPAYMAPEQLTGAPLDSRVDQFAFAIVLYEALAGQRPFAARDLDALRKEVCEGNVRALPRRSEISARVRAVLARALQPDPQERYPSMAALLNDLRPHRRPTGWMMLAAGALIATVSAVSYTMVTEATTGAEAADAQRREQSKRADDAERAVEVREDRLTVSEARALLPTDPTAAIAKLAELTPKGWSIDARAIAAEAMATGIASAVAAGPPGVDGWRLDARNGVFIHRGDEGRFVIIDPQTGAESVFASAMERNGMLPQSAEAVVSRDGTTVASCCDDGELRIASLNDVERPLVLQVGPNPAGFVIAAGGAYVAVLTSTSATVYDIATRTKVRTIPLTERLDTQPIALSPAGDALVGIDAREALMRWSVDAAHEVAPDAFGDIRFSADGRWLAARLTEQTVALWSGTNEAPTEPGQVLEHVKYFELAPLGGRMAYWKSGVRTGISVTDLAPQPEPDRLWLPTEGAPASLMFSADGTTLGATVNEQPHAWDLATGAHLQPRWPVKTVGMHLTADGRSAITFDRTGARVRWRLPWAEHRVARGPVDKPASLAYRGGDLLCSQGPVISKWAASGGVLTEFARMSGKILLLRAEGDRLGAFDGETVRIWEGDESVIDRAVEQVHGFALDVAHERFTTVHDDGVVQTDLRTGETTVVLPLQWERERMPHLGYGRGLSTLTRPGEPVSWWRTDAPHDLQVLALQGTGYHASHDGQALLRSNQADGVSTVHDLDGTVRVSVRGFDALVQLVDADGTMLGRLEDNGVGLWRPGMTAPTPIAPGVEPGHWSRATLAPDQREVAIGKTNGTIVRVPVPRILFDDDPAAVLVTLRPELDPVEVE